MENAKLTRLLSKAGVRQYDCYQCGKCTAGCPMSHAMDIKPRGVMRCMQTGALDSVLKSNTIWLCTGCHTCVDRCPHDVDIPSVIEQARYMAASEGKIRRRSIILNELFVMNLRLFGKNHEMILAGLYNMLSLDVLQDMGSLPHMFKHKLIRLTPHQVKNSKEINKLFERAMKWGLDE